MRNIEKAITKAIELHAGQTRKGDGKTPYIVHPVEVAMIVSKYLNYEPAVIAALLHDTVEDCNYTFEQVETDFGKDARILVELLTEDKSILDYKMRKDMSLSILQASLKDTNHPYFIKAADAISNMRSLVGVLREKGNVVWNSFKAGKKDKIEYYKTILHDTRDFLPPEVFEEYVGLLKDLEYSETFEKPAIGFGQS